MPLVLESEVQAENNFARGPGPGVDENSAGAAAMEKLSSIKWQMILISLLMLKDSRYVQRSPRIEAK